MGGIESDLVQRAGVPFEAIPAAGVHGVGVRTLPGNLWQLGRGYRAARRLLNSFRPDTLFFTGGYVAVPVALAGRKIPTLLYVPDIEPGLALKALARFADRIALTTDDSRAFFPAHTGLAVTGYPTRPDLQAWTKEAALRALDLAPDLPTLLVFGGSKGARSINRALLRILPALLAEMQVVHLTGQLDWPEVQSAQADLAPDRAARYHAHPYLHAEMAATLAAADLVVSRAGASSLGEFPLFGLPAILAPYPYAWRYQQVNARYLEKRGAARILPDSDLPAKLLPLVQELMRDRPMREQMRRAMQSLARPDAALSIADLLLDLAQSHSQERISPC